MSARPGAVARRIRFREAMTASSILVAPGAYDAITARVIQAQGFPAVYVTGAGTTNAQLGLPDVGLVTMAEMAENVARIVEAVDIPVFSDADTGFGGELNVVRTVERFERIGATGVHIEDQVGFKRCGHLDGKEIVPQDEMVAKLEAALWARSDPNFVVMARTDAASVEGVDAALERAHAYAGAGADVIFCEALSSREEFERFAREAPRVPLLANMTEFGRTPMISAAEFQELGYAAVIFPMAAFRLMLRAVTDGMAELARTGSQQQLLDRMTDRRELYEMLDYDPDDPLRRVRESSESVA